MKTSGKLILIFLGVLAAIIVVSAVIIRTSIGFFPSEKKKLNLTEADKTIVDKNYPVDDFDGVDIEGLWKAEILKGDVSSVTVSAPAYIVEYLDITTNGKTLYLSMKEYPVFGTSFPEISVTVVCPALQSLSAEGASMITVRDFDVPDLDVDIKGTVSVKGGGNAIENLALDTEGAVSFDFRDSLSVNADIRMDGMADIKVTMNGGVLTGDLDGIGGVEYYGKVREERIRKNGLASVNRK